MSVQGVGEWEKAKADLHLARSMGVDTVAAFQHDYKSVAEFERKNDVKLPDDITAMLAQE